MKKILFKVLKRIIIGSFLIYFFNYFAIDFNMIIPINFANIFIVSFLGNFGILGLILFKCFIM